MKAFAAFEDLTVLVGLLLALLGAWLLAGLAGVGAVLIVAGLALAAIGLVAAARRA